MAQQQTLSPAPNDLSTHLATRNGRKLEVRPATPEDEPQMLAFLNAVEPEDLRLRFLGLVTQLDAIARALAQTDYGAVENLLAFDEDDGRLVATAMISSESAPTTAEVALLVRSDVKGQGIGWTLLNHTCHWARMRGFKRVDCIELSDNLIALQLEQELGFTKRPSPDEETLTILSKVLD